MNNLENDHTTEITQKYIINELRMIIEENLTNYNKGQLEELQQSKLSFLRQRQKNELEKSINWHDNTYQNLLIEENAKIKHLIDNNLAASYTNHNAIAICKESKENTLSSLDVLTPIDFTNKSGNKSIYIWQFGYDYMTSFIRAFKKQGYSLIDCSINYYNDIHMNVHENNKTLLDFMNNSNVESILQYCIVKHCEILNITLKHEDGKTFTLYRDGYIFDDSLTGELCANVFNTIKNVISE